MSTKKVSSKPVKGRIKDIDIRLIDEPKQDIREWIPQEHIDNLAESLRAVGLIHEPLVVEHDGRYEVISGHCRQLAAMQLGWEKLRCKVVNTEEVEQEFYKLHENLYRQNLTAVEKARALHRAKTRYQLKDDELAQRFGMSRPWVSRMIKALTWPEEIQRANLDGVLSFEVCDALAKIKSPEVLDRYIRYAVQDGCSKRLAKEWYREWLRNERLKENLRVREEDIKDHPLIASDDELVEKAREQQQQDVRQRTRGIMKACSLCGKAHPQDQLINWDLCPECVQFLYDQTQDRVKESVPPGEGK